jgi:SAM-dependent methyltransferase
VAEGGWWETERTKLLSAELGPYVPRSGLTIDLGCGRGEAVAQLSADGARYVIGLDAERYPQWKPVTDRYSFVVCDARRLPFREGVADLVTSFDVIEHFADDSAPLSSARQLVRSSGNVAVTVPALPGLWSKFDELVGHHRRYTRRSLEDSVRGVGLDTRRTTYFFAWLVAPMWLLRKRDRSQSDAVDGSLVGRLAARVTSMFGAAERFVLRRRQLPFGTSLLAICSPSTAAETDVAADRVVEPATP